MLNNSQDNIELNGKTITFYSYKGGVGRSMALVNIACLMAKNKKKVLLIDWDLEAPGLHSFLSDSIKNEELGLVDLITDVIDFVKTEDNNIEDKYISFLNENLGKYIINDLVVDDKIKIDIIKAGKFGNEYSPKLNDINWLDLYTKSPAFFRTFAQLLETKYDYILIDSRTGLADTSGVCTMLMPQILVLVFALNNQNINGVIDVAKQSIDYRYDSNDFRSLTVLPLPSRIDNENSTELSKWIKIYKEEFEKLFKESYFLDECNLENYFNLSKIPYKANYAYGENIPVVYESTENDLFISYHYNQFQKLIDDSTPIWDILSLEELETQNKKALNYFQKGLEFLHAKEYEKACYEFEKTINLIPDNEASYNNWGNALAKLAILKNDQNIFEECFEKYKKATELDPTDETSLYNWGNAISELAKLKNDEELYKNSFEKFKKASELNQTEDAIFYNWGNAISDLAELKKDEKLYYESFEKYKIASKLNPKDDSIFINWANVMSDLAELKNDHDLYIDSFDKYNKASELNPTNASIFNNWGTAISDLAKLKKDAEQYNNSFEKFKRASELNQTDEFIFFNWANAISDFAELKNDHDLYIDSFDKYNKASELNPTKYSIFFNWANAISDLAELKNDHDLYIDSFEKYNKASELNPTNYSIFLNWGNAISNLAKLKKDDNLYRESFDKFNKASELNPTRYSIFFNWANTIANLAELRKDEELYKESFEKFKKASELDPTNDSIFYNWGTTILDLAQLKDDPNLYELCSEKYKTAIDLNPKNNSNYYNLGNALMHLAILKNDVTLFDYSFENLKKSIELGSDSYNLACLYALKNEKEDALATLDFCLSKNEINVDFILKDEDWKNFYEDKDFIELSNKYMKV